MLQHHVLAPFAEPVARTRGDRTLSIGAEHCGLFGARPSGELWSPELYCHWVHHSVELGLAQGTGLGLLGGVYRRNPYHPSAPVDPLQLGSL